MESFMFDLALEYPALAPIISVLSLILPFILIAIALILYYRLAFGLYKIAQNQNISNSWMALIPILQIYTMGKIANETKIGNFIIPKVEILLPITSILSFGKIFSVSSFDSMGIMLFKLQLIQAFGKLSNFLAIIGQISSIISLILLYLVTYNIYKKFRPNKAVKMIIISIVTLGIAIPIYIFKLKDELPTISKEQYFEL